MASAPDDAGDVFDQFLTDRGHAVDEVGWEREYNKKQCPECSGLHDLSASSCTVCGWEPSV
ncbi:MULTISPECIES: HVO_0416 family zinc finger protein [Natrialba]|uniref:HVO_0416 family zinc finger protein n=1 Tax=Natrialba TaxID=63742 RepID=UPI000A005950|nr:MULTISPECIES: HVO_0416 family zinc finger protein [Natrialba]